MNITSSDIILLGHAGFGVLGCLMAFWVFVEALNASAANRSRIRGAAMLVAVCMAAAWLLGGYWYVNLYAPEKALILAGPWPFAHNVAMEVKEHLFFVTALLALLLPITTRENLDINRAARGMVLCVSALVAVSGLMVEGAGAVIDHGVKVSLLRADARSVKQGVK